MATIKIISDPYRKNVLFQVKDESTGEWNIVDQQNNPSSELIKEDIVTNFFPYKAKEIIEILKKEYLVPGEQLTIVFEGTTDEYNELSEVCKDQDNIVLERSNKGLENARDILPKIVDIFTMIKPIVDKNITDDEVREIVDHNILKFTDASNDIVPICVLGNYSSGKSTFINSLIGMEILPSGDMPVTAKIYKIKQLYDKDKAHITFKLNNHDVDVLISGDQYELKSDEKTLTPIIKEVLENNQDDPLAKRVYQCLEVINKQGKAASDLISIDVPFADGQLKQAENSFVILDTPGSNSATFRDHFSILEGAMKNLSNGIPIYVAEFNSLDTCDNKTLFTKIKEIDQIDSRFTMIVVNKADSANIKEKTFSKEMEQAILGQSIPTNLYSGGIYFVSSIMGLGSKNNGDFIDDHAAEFYEDNNKKYVNPESRWYKELYKYNIMPEQIKHTIVEASENSDNAIYANSGLLAVEHEIINFAEKYSAYDKCKQSDKYIEQIIRITQDEIVFAQDASEKKKAELEQELEKDKKELINTMEHKSNSLVLEAADMYDDCLKNDLESVKFEYDKSDIKQIEQNIMKDKRRLHGYDEKSDILKKSRAAVLDSITDIKNKKIGDYVNGIKNDIKETLDNSRELYDAKVASDKDTVDEVIKVVSDDYNERTEKAIDNVDKASRDYWEEKSQEVKDTLLTIVANTTALDDEKKAELSNIIITYGDIDFQDESVFRRAEFERKVQLLWLVIDLNKVNISKLTEAYNTHYAESIESAYATLKQNHKRSFATWRKMLVGKLRSNIVSYNPKLLALSQKIEKETSIIEELSATESTLKNYSKEIISLMDWKDLD